VAPDDVKVTVFPAQIVAADAAAVTVGVGVTKTVDVVKPLQPKELVPITE
jgi:hypothetical protein